MEENMVSKVEDIDANVMSETKAMDNNQEAIGSKRTIYDILKVAFSNLIKLLSGVLVGFLLPKIIGVTDYGYYKTFTLYATYVGLFHFGISDGIYLKFGGKNYEELNIFKFRFYSKFLIIFESILSIFIAIIAIFSLPGELKFIFICLAVYLIANNITGYYQHISQITGRFTELTLRNIIQSVFTILSIIVLWFVHHFYDSIISYQIYTIVHNSIILLLALWYIFTYRNITFGNSESFKDGKKEIFEFIKIGFPLLVANLCSSLILTLDRQFVNIFFDTDDYAIYAFAYNMLSLVTTATSAISTVLYPTLKKNDEVILKKNYSRLVSIILNVVFICLLIFYPLDWFVNLFLPKYSSSIKIFRIIFPGLAISSVITIIMHNYYKTLNKNFLYFIKSIVILFISAIFNLGAYYIFKSTEAISIASIMTMLIWYIYIEIFFIKKYHVKWLKNFLFMIFMVILFYLITFIDNVYLGFFVHFVVYSVVIYIFNFKNINDFIKNNIFKHKKNEV